MDVLNQHGFRISIPRKRNPCDKAAAEGLIRTLKSEDVYLWEYRPLNDVQNRLLFIEEVNNHKRLHFAIGYILPVEFEELSTKPNPARLL